MNHDGLIEPGPAVPADSPTTRIHKMTILNGPASLLSCDTLYSVPLQGDRFLFHSPFKMPSYPVTRGFFL